MRDHKLYALALSEIRLPGTGVTDVGGGFWLLFSGGPTDFLGGVGDPMSPQAYRAWCVAHRRVHTWNSGRLISISLALDQGEGLWHLASVYGPTLQSTPAEKTNFLRDLTEFWDRVPHREPAFAIGDFSARVGFRPLAGPGQVPACVLGPFGLGRANSNGDALLGHASVQRLKILNSFFSHDLAHTASWTHHRWHSHGVLDLALTRQSCFRFVTDCHALPGAEVSSDHKLMILKLRACPQRRPQHAIPSPVTPAPGSTRKPRLNLTALRAAAGRASFAAAAAAAVTNLPSASFATLPLALRAAGESTLGVSTTVRPTWRDGHEQQLASLAQARQRAFTALQAQPDSPACLAALRAARHGARTVVRRLKADWWQREMVRLESVSRRHDAHVLYGDVKALGRLFKGKGLHSLPLTSQHSADAVAAHFHGIHTSQHFSPGFASAAPTSRSFTVPTGPLGPSELRRASCGHQAIVKPQSPGRTGSSC